MLPASFLATRRLFGFVDVSTLIMFVSLNTQDQYSYCYLSLLPAKRGRHLQPPQPYLQRSRSDCVAGCLSENVHPLHAVGGLSAHCCFSCLTGNHRAVHNGDKMHCKVHKMSVKLKMPPPTPRGSVITFYPDRIFCSRLSNNNTWV